jgi:hypothetical protein
MLWLLDKAGAAQTVLYEHESLVATERFREHSEWTGKFPLSNYDDLNDAYFALVADRSEVYLVERVERVTDPTKGDPHVIAKGRSASALLYTRTIEGTETWDTMTAGAMISDMMSALTGSRALSLTFGTGDTVGSTFSLQRSWSDMDTVALEILAAQEMGMRTRVDGAAATLDVFAAEDSGVNLGEHYGDGSTANLIRDDAEWRNYAYVLGEGEGSAREQVIVDQTGTQERRELYVDARDLAQDTLTLAQYQALLAARGAAKLADTRRLEFGEAALSTSSTTAAALRCGDVVYYDTPAWGGSFMVSEIVVTHEKKSVRYSVALGDTPATLKKTLRRYF